MAETKTRKTGVSVTGYIAAVSNETRRADARVVLKLMQKITGHKPKMWGPSIIGFDEYHYKYASGHEGVICRIGFSPRSAALVLYTLPGFDGQAALLKQLGKHKHGKGCLYINKLADVDMKVLEKIMKTAYAWMKKHHPITK